MTTTEETMMTDHTEMQIPDDVAMTADEEVGERNQWRVFTREDIARIILAERERCARIAENYDHGVYAAEAIRGNIE